MSETDRDSINAQLRAEFGDIVTRENLTAFVAQHNVTFPYWIANDPQFREGRGRYRVPPSSPAVPAVQPTPAVAPVSVPVPSASWAAATAQVKAIQTVEVNAKLDKFERLAQDASSLSTVPDIDKSFVEFGDYPRMKTVIKSRKFFPMFITGLSGNGKTLGVEQACAQLGREYIRVNITLETDEDDLLGGFRLLNGETVFEPGPVIVAMLRGAVLLIDEIDLASPKIMCIQPILEGKPITLKKLGIVVRPAPGFTVFATANTKGRGSEDGKFIGTGLLNESFLERFPVTIEQMYPDEATEKIILRKKFESLGGKMDATTTAFFGTLAKWATKVRETYFEGGIEDVISTRRLGHIVTAFVIFSETDGPLEAQAQALGGCINRFDSKVKDALVDFYNKLAPDSSAPDSTGRYDGGAVDEPGEF